MKISHFLALTVALSPALTMAGPLDDLLGAALKAAAGEKTPAAYGTDRYGNPKPRDEYKAQRIDEWARESVTRWDFSKGGTVEDFCAKIRGQQGDPDNLPYLQDCEAKFSAEFGSARQRYAESVEKRAKAERDEADRRLALQQDEDRIAALEKQKAATRDADLRAGRVKPQNLGEVAIAHNAEIGVDLASAPKVRPDGKLYALPGKIAIADESPEFLAQFTLGDQNDALYRAAGRSHEINNRYFSVRIPKALQAYYFDQAKIGRGFDVVGKYVANTKYKTRDGQDKAAPVFEAVYFVMWQ